MELVKPNATKDYIVQSLHWCINMGQNEVLKTMLWTYFTNSKLSDMTELCFELLSKVVSTGSRDQLQLLLHFVDEEYLLNDDNEAGRTCLLRLLYQAVTKGNVATTELLIENRASIDTLDRGKSPLKAAIEHGHIEVLKLLVTRGADVKNTIIPVIQSSMERKEEVIDFLFKHGADPNRPGTNGRLPIHVASMNSPHVVDKLIDLGCDVNAIDQIHGEISMHVACGMCCRETVEILVKHGADFNVLNNQGETPLHKLLKFATNFRHDFHAQSRIELAYFLVTLGFVINQQNSVKKNTRKFRGRDKVLDLYKSVVTSSRSVFTLQHICRLCIRKNIHAEKVTDRLKSLNIPTYLINFLKYVDGFHHKASVPVKYTLG